MELGERKKHKHGQTWLGLPNSSNFRKMSRFSGNPGWRVQDFLLPGIFQLGFLKNLSRSFILRPDHFNFRFNQIRRSISYEWLNRGSSLCIYQWLYPGATIWLSTGLSGSLYFNHPSSPHYSTQGSPLKYRSTCEGNKNCMCVYPQSLVFPLGRRSRFQKQSVV